MRAYPLALITLITLPAKMLKKKKKTKKVAVCVVTHWYHLCSRP